MNRRSTLTVITLGLIVSFLALPAQGDWWSNNETIKGKGSPEREIREINAVTRVELSTIGTLFIELGDRPELVVEAQGNLQEFIETKLRRGYLEIRTRRGIGLRPTKAIKYHLTVTALEEIAISSSGGIVVGDVTAERLTIDISSSGDVEVADIECPRLDVFISSSGDALIDSWKGTTLRADLSSSGDLEIRGGTADELDIDISSSGDCIARKLASRSATVRVSSSGDAEIRVSDRLNARTSSSGDIVYYGRPEVDGRSSSSGDIYRGGS
jgi:hypothetical protein